jgi:hypothetical protein
MEKNMGIQNPRDNVALIGEKTHGFQVKLKYQHRINSAHV